jgi:hypothetical protein
MVGRRAARAGAAGGGGDRLEAARRGGACKSFGSDVGSGACGPRRPPECARRTAPCTSGGGAPTRAEWPVLSGRCLRAADWAPPGVAIRTMPDREPSQGRTRSARLGMSATLAFAETGRIISGSRRRGHDALANAERQRRGSHHTQVSLASVSARPRETSLWLARKQGRRAVGTDNRATLDRFIDGMIRGDWTRSVTSSPTMGWLTGRSLASGWSDARPA